jgi:hypothetical protein
MPIKSKVGRPKKKRISGNTHYNRPQIKSNHPMHITVKLLPVCQNLRNKKVSQILKFAVLRARKAGIRIVEFSLQK